MGEDIFRKFGVKRRSLPGMLYIPASANGSYVPGISRLVRKAHNVAKSIYVGLSVPFAVGREVLAYFWRGSPDLSIKDPDKVAERTQRRGGLEIPLFLLKRLE